MSADRHGLLLGLGRLVTVATFCLMYASTFWLYRLSVALVAQALGILGLLGLAASESEPGLLASLAGLSVLVGYNYYAGLYYSTTGSAVDRQATGGGIHEATLAAWPDGRFVMRRLGWILMVPPVRHSCLQPQLLPGWLHCVSCCTGGKLGRGT